MEFYHIVVLLTIYLITGVHARKQSVKLVNGYFQICHRSDPDVSKCMKNTLEDLKPRIIKGIPELGLVPLDPLNIPRLEMSEGSGNFKMQQVLRNVTIHGIRDCEVIDVRMDFDTLIMEMYLKVPFMMFTADYEMEGQILILPVRGEGDCVLKFTDVTITCRSSLEVVTLDGEQFLQVKDLNWVLNAANSSFQFNNLFNGDKVLGEATNRFLNENSREAFKTFKNLPEKAFGVLFKDFSNRVYREFTYKELFPK